MEEMRNLIKETEELLNLLKSNMKATEGCISVKTVMRKESEILKRLKDNRIKKQIRVDSLSNTEAVALLYLLCIAKPCSKKLEIEIIDKNGMLIKKLQSESNLLLAVWQEVQELESDYLMLDFYYAIWKSIEN